MKPRSSHRRCSVKKVFLEISQNSQENTCAQVAQVFSCEFCEISKNKFFPELLRWLLLETNSCVLFCHSLPISKHMEVLQRRSNSSTVLKTNIHDLTIASLLYTLRAHKKQKRFSYCQFTPMKLIIQMFPVTYYLYLIFTI